MPVGRLSTAWPRAVSARVTAERIAASSSTSRMLAMPRP